MNTKTFRLVTSGFLISTLLAVSLPWQVSAAVSSWNVKGINVSPTSTTDYGSEQFRTSMRNWKAVGGNYVSLIVPYYVPDRFSTDIQRGWNTPTDDSLASGISYARSIGLKVNVKIHMEVYDGTWRAFIDPAEGNRSTWFQRYGDVLVNTAKIAEANHAESFTMGAEMVSMSLNNYHANNTQFWNTLIGRVRGVFSGQVGYNANSSASNDDPYSNEKKFIKFWPNLDFISISAYFNVPGNSVSEMKQSWDFINKSDIQKFQQQFGKPLVFGEVGYRSIPNSNINPWDHGRGGPYDENTQANAYDALCGYWNDYSFMQGAYLWKWEVNPNAGGQGDIDYTPQNKKAQGTIQRWFGGSGTTPTTTNPNPEPNPNPQPNPTPTEPPPPPQSENYTVSVTTNPSSPQPGNSVTVTASVTSGTDRSNRILDLELYNSSGQKVEQTFKEGQNLSANSAQTISLSSTLPSGTYTAKLGVFSSGWASNTYWNDNALTFAVSTTPTTPQNPPTNPPPTNNPPPSGPAVLDIWWPTNGATVSGTQPFKAMVQDKNVSDYKMFWQVDGRQLNEMGNSDVDWPHKESIVDLGPWTWNADGNYTVNFVAKDNSGTTIVEKSVTINVAH